MQDIITADRLRYGSGRLKTFLHPGFRFVFLLRMCSRTSKLTPWGMAFRFWFSLMKIRFGFQIPHTTKIGPGFFMGHYGNIVINHRTVIGRNCNVAQGVTIGQINVGEKAGCPSIGDRVWIGANAVIVGSITIGDDVMIAPLTFVNFDVPPNSLVIGNPAKILADKGGSKGYINNIS